jgi:hypothetical protein
LTGAALSIFSLTSTEHLTVLADFTLRNASSVAATLGLTGGTITANAALDVSGLTWTAGTLQGVGIVTVTDTLTISGSSKSLVETTLVNKDAATISNSSLLMATDATLRNDVGATIDIAGDVGIFANGGSNNLIDNYGTITRSSGIGTVDVSVRFENSGALEIRTGTINAIGGYTQSAAGRLQLDIGGTTAADIGRLTGITVTLDGELALNITGGYAPTLGDVLGVMTYTTRNGTFATLSGTALGGGLQLQETYGATALTFEVVTP